MKDTFDVSMQGRTGSGISDYLLLCKVKVMRRKKQRRNRSGGKYVINVEELRHNVVAKQHERRISEKWEEQK